MGICIIGSKHRAQPIPDDTHSHNLIQLLIDFILLAHPHRAEWVTVAIAAQVEQAPEIIPKGGFTIVCTLGEFDVLRRGFANAAAISEVPARSQRGLQLLTQLMPCRTEQLAFAASERNAMEAELVIPESYWEARYSALKRNERAVVLGASMSGLFAARVLAEFYSRVTVVDRDVLPQEPRNRRGVPQGAHIHIMQARGSHALEELFPGLRGELAADGAPIWDDGDLASFHVSVGGHILAQSGRLRYPEDSVQYFASRPLLESHVRRRLRAYPNVTILDGHDAVGLTFNTARDGVTGVRLAKRDTADETTLPAELVVDATGRGSRTPVFLADLGYGRPREDELVVHLAYATQPLRIPSGSLRENFFVVNPKPDRPTGFGLQVCENDLWMLTLISMVGHELPTERCGMLTFLEQHAPAKAFAAVRAAKTLGEVTHYRVPSSRWRRYDKMRQTPAGLIVIGDAICSFNPIYAQGMTVAALEAILLRECLRRGQRDLPQRFFRASARPIGAAWQTAVGSDLALPEVDAPRSLGVRLRNKFMQQVLNAAETDALMADHFLRVVGMIDAPTRLLHPDVLFRIVKSFYALRTTGSYERAQGSLAVSKQPQ